MSARLAVASVCVAVACLGATAFAAERTEDALSRRSRKHLQQIGLAFHNYHEDHGTLPGFANVDDAGQPLLSWRVHLLAYMGPKERKLYREFHLDEPWDSDHNEQLIERMPDVYAVPLEKPLPPGRTCYLVPRSESTLFPPNTNNNVWRLSFDDVYQGIPNILLVVEADRQAAVPWTKPQDLPFDRTRPLAGLGHLRGEGFLAAWCSGRITFVPDTAGAGRADRTELLRGFFERVGDRGVSDYFGFE